MTFFELYNSLLDKTYRGDNSFNDLEDEAQLDCLLNPRNYAPVIADGRCNCSQDSKHKCDDVCLFGAVGRDAEGNVTIDKDNCVGCGACVDNCNSKVLLANKESLAVMREIREGKQVYAMVAPAFIGQFSKDVTPGKLRAAFKSMGFAGMIEVALFADILTLKEALEFDKSVISDSDFLLTSCCCPIWIAMIRKVYSELSSHIPGAVSPMVACGRTIKKIHPDAITVFIGPCLAKKSEAREPDVADSTDYVLTFKEVMELFEGFGINPELMKSDAKEHSSKAGRIYARTGGVSEALKATLERIAPDKPIKVKTVAVDGIPACKAILEKLKSGNPDANFIEGMGCVGGCVGGPRAVLPKEEGCAGVNEYGEEAVYKTPIDNPYVIELLERLGMKDIESLLEDSEIFTRDFSK